MKRPISILCLADIHYEALKDMGEIDSLCKDFSDYVYSDVKNYKWIPDYLVIAGDLAQQNKSYEGLHEFIDEFCQKFRIDKSHIVIVPGNHDKKTSGCCSLFSKDEGLKIQKDIFESYCKKPEKEENKKKFEKEFGCRFKEFIDFCKEYNGDELQFEECDEAPQKDTSPSPKPIGSNGDSPKSLPNDSILDKELWCLSGVKVFEKDHLCFHCVNTEWLYTDGRSQAVVTSDDGCDITRYMRLDENCHLCSPLIKKACKLIQERYSDYTVVSVMHRGFDHLSWEERNNSDRSSIDSIKYIINTSNVIITGHDHMFNPKPPTLIDNKVQHFQLGSVGRKERYDSEYSRFAEVIRIDTPNNRIEQLFIQQRRGGSHSCWKCSVSEETYPLISKYPSIRENEVYEVDPARIKVNFPDVRIIEDAISKHFKHSQRTDLIIVKAERKVKSVLEHRVSINRGGRAQIVVYYLCDDYKYLKRDIEREISKFREENIKTILQSKIIIHEVIVEYPQYELTIVR